MHIHSAHRAMFTHLNILVRWGGAGGMRRRKVGKQKREEKRGNNVMKTNVCGCVDWDFSMK